MKELELTDLKQKTDEILGLKQNIGNNIFELGQKLNEIYAHKLYLSSYGSWDEYLAKAVDIGSRSAKNFMRISETFDTNFISQWGYAKCNLLLSVEQPVRNKILTHHSPKDSVSQLKQSLQEDSDTGTPRQHISLFLDTEEDLKKLIKQSEFVKEKLLTCAQKSTFAFYGRKIVIEQLWNELKGVINK